MSEIIVVVFSEKLSIRLFCIAN